MKTYRIKEPRCWVVRWDEWPDDPATDYSRDPVVPNGGHMCSRKDAREFASAIDARAWRDNGGVGTPRWWRIVRRGKVSQ